MKAIYCADSQDRIPLEYFLQGKAIWSGGRPFLKVHAQRLGLVPDARPPVEYAEALGYGPQAKAVAPAAPRPILKPTEKILEPFKLPSAPNPQQAEIPKPQPVAPIAPPAPPAAPVLPAEIGTEKVAAPAAPMSAPAAIVKKVEPPPRAPAALEQTILEETPAYVPSPAALVVPKSKTAEAPGDAKRSPLPLVPPSKPPAVAVKAVESAQTTVPQNAAATPVHASKLPPGLTDDRAKPVDLTGQAKKVKPSAAAPVQPAAKVVISSEGVAKELVPVPVPVPVIVPVPVVIPVPAPAVAKLPAAPAKLPAAAKAASEEEEMKLRIPLQPGEPLTIDEMKRLEILEGIPEAAIKMLYGGIVRREFKRGDIICKQGEYASTAFYVLSGKAEIYVVTPDRAALGTLRKKKNNGANGILERLKFWVQGRKEGPRKSKSGRRPDIENDLAPLPPDMRRAEIGPGDLFGEMSCINFYPRSTNVRATEDCVMLELIRTVLDTVRTRKGKYKEKLEKNYRERSLEQHLNSIPLFKDLDPEFIDQLRKKVVLQDFDPGETIFKQGDVPDAFYLVRRGCIKVTQMQPGGELVLTYLGQNDSFGEIGLLRNVKRTATCTALDHVELVKIEKKHFEFLAHCYDEFKDRMEKETDERLAGGRSAAVRPPAQALGEFINQELMQAQNVLLLDLEKCTRCDECVQACIDSHDDGKTRLVREGLRFDKYLVATSCRSCMDPVCMIGCPVGSIRREETFEIIIEDWCIGCEKCAKQCPYGNIKMHEFPRSQEEIDRDIETQRRKAAAAAVNAPNAAAHGKTAEPGKDPALKVALVKDLAVTCDQCSTLQEPSCVYACPHEAAMRVNARDFFEIVDKRTLKDKPKSVKTE